MDTCPLWAPAPLCMTARVQGCPGGAACARDQAAIVARADAELARRRAAGEDPMRWATTAEELGGEEPEDAP